MLPVGYVALVDMVLANNAEFIRIAQKELREKQLGPFASEAGREEAERAEARVLPQPFLQRVSSSMPPFIRRFVLPAALLVLLSLGGWWTSGPEANLGWLLVRNLVIAGLFASLFVFRHWLEARVHNGWVSWGVALLLLWLVGTGTQDFLG